MTTRVTVLGTDAQTPGVWTGPQSMVQPSPLLGDDGGAGMLADATSQAIPNTLALRDAAASFAVKELDYDAGAAPSAATATTVRTYYDTATRLFNIETVAGNFIVSGSPTSEGVLRLDFGGDDSVNDEISLWASAAALDGPRLSMGYTSGNVGLFCDDFGLNDITGANSVAMRISGANTLEFEGAVSVTLDAVNGQEMTVRGRNGLNLISPTGASGAAGAFEMLFTGSGGARQHGFVYGQGQTIDAATPVTICEIPVPDGGARFFNIFIVGYSTTGPTAFAFQRIGVARRTGAAATIANFSVFYSNGDAALNTSTVTLLAPGSTVQVIMNGVAGRTIRWECYAYVADAAP